MHQQALFILQCQQRGEHFLKRGPKLADQRLIAGAHPADTTALLGTVNKLTVFSHAPSANFCAHRNWTRANCARTRTTGLLAQQVATVLPEAVSTPSTLTLARPVPRSQLSGTNATTRTRGGGSDRPPAAQPDVLERVQGLQSLNVHVLIAQLVGAVQAQSKQIEEQSKQIEKQSQRIAQLEAPHPRNQI